MGDIIITIVHLLIIALKETYLKGGKIKRYTQTHTHTYLPQIFYILSYSRTWLKFNNLYTTPWVR